MRGLWKKLITLGLTLSLVLICCLAESANEVGAEPTDEQIAEFEATVEAEGGAGIWITWPVARILPWQEYLGLEGVLQEETPEGWLGRDEAIAIARSTILAHEDTAWAQAWLGVRDPEPVTEEFVNSLSVAAFCAAQDEEGRDIWYVWIYHPDWLVPALDAFEVILDAHTGDVLWEVSPGGMG